MAVTWTKQALRPIAPDNSFLSLIERYVPVGAAQTFPPGSPLKIASGLFIVFVTPSDADLAAFSLETAPTTTGADVEVILAVPSVEFEANFLGSAAADNALAAADLGTSFDLAASATLVKGSEAGWYLQDSTSSVAAKISAFRAEIPEPNQTQSQPATGDTNARVRCMPLFSVLHWD